jgi:hypothetical protein
MGVTVRRWSLGVGGAAVLIVAFLPWVRSGERDRNSFELLRSADRLDLLDGVVQRAAQIGWLLLPVAVGIVVVALALGHGRIAAAGALAAGLASLIIGALVVGSSLDTTAWPAVASVLGVGVALVATIELVQGRTSGRVSTKPTVGDVSGP